MAPFLLGCLPVTQIIRPLYTRYLSSLNWGEVGKFSYPSRGDIGKFSDASPNLSLDLGLRDAAVTFSLLIKREFQFFERILLPPGGSNPPTFWWDSFQSFALPTVLSELLMKDGSYLSVSIFIIHIFLIFGWTHPYRVRKCIPHAILRKEIGFLEEQNLPWDFFPFLDQTCLASLRSADNSLITESEKLSLGMFCSSSNPFLTMIAWRNIYSLFTTSRKVVIFCEKRAR